MPLSCPFLWAVGYAFPLALLGGQVSFLPRAPQSSWVSGAQLDSYKHHPPDSLVPACVPILLPLVTFPGSSAAAVRALPRARPAPFPGPSLMHCPRGPCLTPSACRSLMRLDPHAHPQHPAVAVGSARPLSPGHCGQPASYPTPLGPATALPTEGLPPPPALVLGSHPAPAKRKGGSQSGTGTLKMP